MFSNRQYDRNITFTQRYNNANLIDLQSTINLNWKTFSDFIHNQIKNSPDNESKKKNKFNIYYLILFLLMHLKI